jgi:hypothetical protein
VAPGPKCIDQPLTGGNPTPSSRWTALISPDTETTDPFELHQFNIKRIREGDVMIATYPGSGCSLITNILTELGFAHFDPYTEVLDANGAAIVLPGMLPYRSRLAAVATADVAGHADGPGIRFVKNHLPPRHFAGASFGGAVLLVRDPRDAVYSSYRYFREFARFWWPDTDKGQGTFEEYMDGLGVSHPAHPGLVDFYRAWHATLPRQAIVRGIGRSFRGVVAADTRPRRWRGVARPVRADTCQLGQRMSAKVLACQVEGRCRTAG